MKRLLLLASSGLLMFGCQNSSKDQNENVVSKRYIHKYGYDVSKEEWESTGYPGQVITTLRNGVTVTSSYEDGRLHGPTTYTYPHSNTNESESIYERGNLVKKTSYDIRGIPQKEEVFLSPSHVKLTKWFQSGTPMSVEEYHNEELLEGEYYNKRNEAEHRVIKGTGTRTIRDEHENVILQEKMEGGFTVLRETFHPHGIPHTVLPLSGGLVHGEKKVFAPSGEPISVETYERDLLHGRATYYQNGCRYLEINYYQGRKDGTERHFVDGETVVEETEWMDGQKHGPSIVFFDGMSRTRYYYNDQLVTKEKYRELYEMEENIAIMNDRALHRD
ncbi:toxin-antitoxin system YwqK family antitoxin [Candidatus Neptunochlamydia vexilliferae]|uniref:toxin-antitoxin system YwqK family antitoxin n=1 Tax=Candidatus Neptunichlamydia vexilliferae TaxID=1651774 RepID=UPI001890C98F|nr:hypothetical protein [Candidatus Neptunochlamydia vexilliferae]